jgi:hypothetical protein
MSDWRSATLSVVKESVPNLVVRHIGRDFDLHMNET